MEIVPYEKKRGATKDHSLSQWFSNFSEADELLKLAAARQQVRLGLRHVMWCYWD
jgi:YEATS domain-containing protein 4